MPESSSSSRSTSKCETCLTESVKKLEIWKSANKKIDFFLRIEIHVKRLEMWERFETDGGLHHIFYKVVIEVEGLDST